MSAVPPPSVPEWTLADRLRKARELAGYSQAELATATGISQRSIIRYERGQAEPRRPELLAWATACHVKYEWLTGGPSSEEQVQALADGWRRRQAAVKRPA